MRELSEKYFPLIEKQLSSSLTVKEFCKANGINHKTLYHWKKKFLERNKASVQAIKPGFTALSHLEFAFHSIREKIALELGSYKEARELQEAIHAIRNSSMFPKPNR